MILYECDPNKNKTCAKTACQSVCFLTRNKDYACYNPDGDPIIAYGENNEQASEKPAQVVPTVEEVPEKTIKRFKYEDFVSALDEDWEKTGDYRDFKSNGEWHGERIDPSDPRRK